MLIDAKRSRGTQGGKKEEVKIRRNDRPTEKEIMDGIKHRTVDVNGISMHVAEKGEGPVVLLLHGFPELWYSWRHQILGLADRGYRAVAPDLRGYGDSSAPPSVGSYTIFHIVGDLVALLDELEQHQVFVVGHDWGALVAWNLCLLRPDRVKALVNLSVAFTPRVPAIKPLDYFRAMWGEDYYVCRSQFIFRILVNLIVAFIFALSVTLLPRIPMVKLVNYFRAIYESDHYVCRFQEPGAIEAESARLGTGLLLRKIFSYRNPGPIFIPKEGWGSPDEHIELPSWLSEEDIDYYTSKFEKSGFTGPVNYYRCLNLNWELTAPWSAAQIKVPTKFIVGNLDLTYHWPGGLKRDVPYLEDVVVKDAAHFINQERANEVTEHIYDFIRKF